MSNTRQLIVQAARELEIEGLEVTPDLEAIGSYTVKWEGHEIKIPMAADYKGIVKAMKAEQSKGA